MKFVTTSDTCRVSGTCLQGRVNITYDKLVEVFGEPTSNGDEYKVQKEWIVEFEDGTVATIYDYKQGDEYNGPGQGTHYTKVTDWHVGGHSHVAAQRVADALFDAVHNCVTVDNVEPTKLIEN